MADLQTYQNFLSVDNVQELPDVTTDISIAIQSQYAHAKDFVNLGAKVQRSVDATEDVDKFQYAISAPDTAYGVFLDWWGKRVGVDRLIKVEGKHIKLDDEFFRFLIFYRAVCNVSGGSAFTTNTLLQKLTDSTVFVIDYLDMSINSIIIIGSLSPLQTAIMQAYGLLNRPAGVLANMLVIYPDEQIFGFEGSGLLPFDVGVFNPGREITLG